MMHDRESLSTLRILILFSVVRANHKSEREDDGSDGTRAPNPLVDHSRESKIPRNEMNPAQNYRHQRANDHTRFYAPDFPLAVLVVFFDAYASSIGVFSRYFGDLRVESWI